MIRSVAPLLMMIFLSTDVERARVVSDYVQPRVSYANIAVANAALTTTDVERWVTFLNASDAQAHHMQLKYAAFVQSHNALLDREAPRLLAASAELSEAIQQEGFTTALPAKLDSQRQRSTQLRRQLKLAEQEYINSIEPVMTEEQAVLLPTLHNEAIRRQTRTRSSEVRWVDVELSRIWEKVNHDTMTPEELRGTRTMLQEYENAMTPLFRRLSDIQWDLPTRISTLVADMQAEVISSDEFQVRQDRVRAVYLRSLQRISNLNKTTVRLITDTLADEVADDFLQYANAAAFPELYPDRAAIHHVYEAVIHDDALGEDLQHAAAALFDDYSAQYDQMNRTLQEFCISWGEQSAMGRDGYQAQLFPEALAPKLRDRRELSEQWLERLTAIVGEDIVESHQFGFEE